MRYGNTNDCNSYGYSYEFPDQAGVPKLEIEYYDTEHEGSQRDHADKRNINGLGRYGYASINTTETSF